MPSIKVMLEPPEDPLPQVSASIQLLEKERLKTEESLMSKLEDVYNTVLDKSQKSIEETIAKSMAMFEDKTFLEAVVRGSLQQIASPSNLLHSKQRPFSFKQNLTNTTKNSTTVSTGETSNQDKAPLRESSDLDPLAGFNATKTRTLQKVDNDSSGLKTPQLLSKHINTNPQIHLTNGPLDIPTFVQLSSKVTNNLKSSAASKLQTQHKLPWANVATNVLKKLENSAAPSVNVEVVDLFEPDPTIEKKMNEIEEKRNDEEGKMFELAAEELSLLTNIMEEELKKNIQIQLNVFLADAKSVKTTVESVSRQIFPQKTQKFTQIFSHNSSRGLLKHLNKRCETLQRKFPLVKWSCAKKNFPRSKRKKFSFLQMQSQLAIRDSAPSMNPEQLNVRIGSSEHAYPTVDEMVDNMEKRRDATERLERAKILELHVTLMKAQIEMIKDALHTRLARILALYGSMTDTIKEESLYAKLKS